MRSLVWVMTMIVVTLQMHPARAIAGDAVPGIDAADEDPILHSLYTRPGAALLWSASGQLTGQARQLIALLQTADAWGLEPADYGADLLAAEAGRLSSASTPADWAAFDALLSRATVRFISHLHYGRVDPRAAGFELDEPRKDLDVMTSVVSLASSVDVRGSLNAVEPRFLHYGLLKAALAKYAALQGDPTLTAIPGTAGRKLHVGDGYAGAPALRRLLTALGDLPAAVAAPATDPILDAALVGALKRFQSRHGLAADGILDSRLAALLATPLTVPVEQIKLTLERWRWLPPFDTPPIIVNIPQFRLFAFQTVEDRAASIMQMDVIVGQAYPRKQTPVFLAEMRYVIFRPYWDVPRSITLREMLPKLHKNPGYLQKNNLEIVRGASDESPALPPDAAALAALTSGEARLRQRPGADNALGLIKFMFPNVHDVYLHSTPEHQLFLRSNRAFSHGCIRVSDPVALAAFVLRNADGVWDTARIDAAMQQGPDSFRVELRTPIRVMVLYGTAQATEAGPVLFFNDIYGQDRKLETLLNEARARHGSTGR